MPLTAPPHRAADAAAALAKCPPAERRAYLTRERGTVAADLATARSTLARLVAASGVPSALMAARADVATLEARLAELDAALPVLDAEIAEAAQRAEQAAAAADVARARQDDARAALLTLEGAVHAAARDVVRPAYVAYLAALQRAKAAHLTAEQAAGRRGRDAEPMRDTVDVMPSERRRDLFAFVEALVRYAERDALSGEAAAFPDLPDAVGPV